MTAIGILLAAMSFSDVAALTRTEAANGGSVCATGVVTQVVGWREVSGVFADVADPGGRGIYFSGETQRNPTARIEGADEFRLGDVIEVKGVTTPLSFAPGIQAASIRVVGRMDLPPFAEATLFDMRGGRLDNARVKLRGVLTGVKPVKASRLDPDARIVQLSLNADNGRFVAHVPGTVAEWRPLFDAELEVCGCAMSAFNMRAEFRGVQMEVAAPSDITVVKPPHASPFDLEQTPVSELMSFSPRPSGVHAKRIGGVVTFVCARERFFYLQDGQHGLKVTMDVPDGLSAGEKVDVAGFPVTVDGCGELHGLALKRCGKVPLPEPQYADLDDYSRWQYYSDDGSMNDIVWRRMSFVARVIRAEGDGESSELVVAVSNVTCRVHLEGPLPDIFENAQEMRPLARITAVAEPSISDALTDDRQPVLKSLSFAVASSDDITFIPDGEWRSRVNARVLNAAALAVGTLLAALIGIGIVRIVRDKRESGRIAAITAERKRMAADLHDTIEQNLAGAKMLMESSLSIAPDVPPAVAEAVKGAAAVLAHAKSEIRATIFNLRCDEMFDRKPEDVFREMMRHLDRGKVNARCRLRGLPDHLPGARFSDLLGIVQEATTNAIKHGRAKNIVLVSDPLTGDGVRGFVLRVLNDGEPFDAATALGPESGHFGLAGMRERAKRNGMRISWETKDKWTSVKVEVSAI
jgi:signal transduction histidine kinase